MVDGGAAVYGTEEVAGATAAGCIGPVPASVGAARVVAEGAGAGTTGGAVAVPGGVGAA